MDPLIQYKDEETFSRDYHLVGKLDEEETIYWMKSSFTAGNVFFYSFNSQE